MTQAAQGVMEKISKRLYDKCIVHKDAHADADAYADIDADADADSTKTICLPPWRGRHTDSPVYIKIQASLNAKIR